MITQTFWGCDVVLPCAVFSELSGNFATLCVCFWVKSLVTSHENPLQDIRVQSGYNINTYSHIVINLCFGGVLYKKKIAQ